MIISTERAHHKAIGREQMSSSMEGLENSHRYVYFLKRSYSAIEGREGLRDRGGQIECKAIKSDDVSTEEGGLHWGMFN
jgi:hypothetical protein